MRRLRPEGTIPFLIVFAVLATGCGSESATGPAEISGLPRALSREESHLIDAGNDFTFRLLREVNRSEPDSNLFLAPLSASIALGMTLNGASGNTFDEMRGTLGFGLMSLQDVNQGYRDLIDLLVELDTGVELGIGNSIWYRTGFSVREDFLDRATQYFDAVVQELDFSSSLAPDVINGWVRAQTSGKIKEIVEPPISPLTVMFLINATHFKARWTHRFDKNKTVEADFLHQDGSRAGIRLMEITDTLPYNETEMFQAVDLPYGGGAFSMTILLPGEGASMSDMVASLNPTSWRALVDGFEEKEGTVYLPRFRMEWGKVLNETLKSMGMVDAFVSGAADFTGLSDEALERGLYVSQVKQKTYVDVNEEGTEAAGATVVEISEKAIPDRFSFRADRPFLFVIRERFSGTVLFAGVFMSPPEA